MTNVILGIPGLLAKEESGRLEVISSEFPDAKYIRVGYVEVEQEGNEMRIDFSLLHGVRKFRESLREVKNNGGVSVIASSTGAAILSYALAEENFPIETYIAISPLYRLGKATRDQLINIVGTDTKVDISSTEDKKRGVKRVLTPPSLEDFVRIDCSGNLRGNIPRVKHVLTLIGEKDNIIDTQEAAKYHQAIGGKPEDLVYFQSGHDIPYEGSNDKIIKLLRETIKQ